jgi:hypothetical protein
MRGKKDHAMRCLARWPGTGALAVAACQGPSFSRDETESEL